MIPKTIHYCWFGKGEKNPTIQKCLASWREHLSDYNIVEWNEENFDTNKYEYTKRSYKDKKWAFVSDYARLVILREHGGIYLDTDMFVLKSFNDILTSVTTEGKEFFIGYEDKIHISAGIIASTPNHKYILDLLRYYDRSTVYTPIPKILTEIFNAGSYNIKTFSAIYFYPFTAANIKKFNFKNAPPESYAVHMWNYSWGNPLNKFAKKIGIHVVLVKILDTLKIKVIMKKLLHME